MDSLYPINEIVEAMIYVQLIILLIILTIISVKFFNLLQEQSLRTMSFIAIFSNALLFGVVTIGLLSEYPVLINFNTEISIYETNYNLFFMACFSFILILNLILFYGYEQQIIKSTIHLKYSKNIRLINLSLGLICFAFLVNYLLTNKNIQLLNSNFLMVNNLVIFSIIFIINCYFLIFFIKRGSHSLFWGLNGNILDEGMIGYIVSSSYQNNLNNFVISKKFVEMNKLSEKEIIGLSIISNSSINKNSQDNWALIPIPGQKAKFALTFCIMLNELSNHGNMEKKPNIPIFLSVLVPKSMLIDLPNFNMLQTLLLEELEAKKIFNLDDIMVESNIRPIISKMINKINF